MEQITQTSFGARVADFFALIFTRTDTRRCPYPGCAVHVRFRAVSPQEAQRLTELAVDHARHVKPTER
ncbi:hypothetical protein ACF1HU_35860 [Streptomyces olivaceus]|uniref:hypothetical protein n=1 Tax=Streptomyces olivaceus TaxID=47716 RepID=UPI0036F70B10